MPITAITIENFKGIAEPVTIPIRPITLLFGKNSSGKSTILQALHYLREVLENRRPDPDRTQVGGDTIDLGGFQALVYRNECDRHIRLRVAFSLDYDGIPHNGILRMSENAMEESRDLRYDLNSVVKLEAAWVEVITAWEEGKGAYIAEYATGLNGDELVRLHQLYGFRPELFNVNTDHVIVRALDDDLETNVQEFFKTLRSRYSVFFPQGIDLNKQDSIIPEPDKPFYPYDEFARPHFRDLETELLWSRGGSHVMASEKELLWSMIGQALTGPLAIVLRELRGIRYLGPIRDVPPRNYRSPKTPAESHWACGLGAWDALVRDASLVEKTSDCLRDVLHLGYSIRHEQRLSIDAEGEIMAALRFLAVQYEEKDAAYLCSMVLEPLERLPRRPMIQLHDEVSDIDVDPSDIGVGVSQVLPVVVGALDAGSAESPCRTFAVEQPELHIHPAVQVALGDVFIDAVHGTERTMLIETHSEHLLLRLLRRVRESADATIAPSAPPLTPDMVSIVYVKPKQGGTEITALPITEEGEFTRQWPDGFFEERVEELF